MDRVTFCCDRVVHCSIMSASHAISVCNDWVPALGQVTLVKMKHLCNTLELVILNLVFSVLWVQECR